MRSGTHRAARRATCASASSRAEHLPFPTASADLITSMDVIEHLDDDAALAEYHRVVRPGGLVLLTVPAYPWLWSHHDDWAAHLRRYTRPTLLDAVTRAGLRPVRTTYFNSFLVPPAAVMRRTPVRRLITVEQDEVGAASPLVDRVMTALAVRRAPVGRPRAGRAVRPVDRHAGRAALTTPAASRWCARPAPASG